MIRLIIAGSRTFGNARHYGPDRAAWHREEAHAWLDRMFSARLPQISAILCGEAAGADQIGKAWAAACGLGDRVESYHARWQELGPGAGPVRNAQMVSQATTLVLFWDGQSSGSADIMTQALNASLWVRVIRYDRWRQP